MADGGGGSARGRGRGRGAAVAAAVLGSAAACGVLGAVLLDRRVARARLIVLDMDERGWWWTALAVIIVLTGAALIAAPAWSATLLPISNRLVRLAVAAGLAAAAAPAVAALWCAAAPALLTLEADAFPQEYRTLRGEEVVAVVRETAQPDGTVLLDAGVRRGLLVEFGPGRRIAADPRYDLGAWRFTVGPDGVRWVTPDGATGAPLGVEARQH